MTSPWRTTIRTTLLFARSSVYSHRTVGPKYGCYHTNHNLAPDMGKMSARWQLQEKQVSLRAAAEETRLGRNSHYAAVGKK